MSSSQINLAIRYWKCHPDNENYCILCRKEIDDRELKLIKQLENGDDNAAKLLPSCEEVLMNEKRKKLDNGLIWTPHMAKFENNLPHNEKCVTSWFNKK